MPHQERPRTPIAIIALAAVAATAMAGGILTDHWLTVSERVDQFRVESRMGLWGQASVSQCDPERCNTMSGTLHFDDPRLDSDAKMGVLAGAIGYVTGIVAALALLAMAVLFTLGNPVPRRLRTATWQLSAGAAGTALLFVVLLSQKGEQAIGFSAIVFGVGAACGIIAGVIAQSRPG